MQGIKRTVKDRKYSSGEMSINERLMRHVLETQMLPQKSRYRHNSLAHITIVIS